MVVASTQHVKEVLTRPSTVICTPRGLIGGGTKAARVMVVVVGYPEVYMWIRSTPAENIVIYGSLNCPNDSLSLPICGQWRRKSSGRAEPRGQCPWTGSPQGSGAFRRPGEAPPGGLGSRRADAAPPPPSPLKCH